MLSPSTRPVRSNTAILRPLGVLLAGLLLWSGCQDQTNTSIRTRPEDLAQAPKKHVGETVVISGEVDRIFSPRVFTVGGSDFGQDLLVVSTDSIAQVSGRTGDVPLAERDIVQVTGVVQRLNPSELEQKFGLTVPKRAASAFKNEPAVVALQSAAAMHGVVVSPRLPSGSAGTVNEWRRAADTSAQDALQRRVAALPSAPIQSVVRERMFWVGTGQGDRVFVVANPESTPGMEGEAAQPEPGEEWMVHGLFRELPQPGLLRTEWNLSEEMVSQLEGHEVYLHALKAKPATGTET
ncbi:MAG: hypothetical protein ABEL97_07155 [Salinibacter sp.]